MSASFIEPSTYLLNPFAIPMVLTALFLLNLGVSVILSERGSQLSLVYGIMIVPLIVWMVSLACVMSSSRRVSALILSKGVFLGICFIPPGLMGFATTVSRLHHKKSWWIWSTLAISTLFAGLSLFTDTVVTGVHRFPWGYYPELGPTGIAFLVYHIVVLGFILVILWQRRNQTHNATQRKRLGGILLAIASGYPAIVDVLPLFGIDVFPVGFAFVLLFGFVCLWSIWRYQLTDFSPAFAAEEMMSTMDDPLLVCDLEGTIRLANQACEDVFDFSQEELIGNNFTSLLGASELGQKKTRALQQGELTGAREFKFKDKHQESVDVKVSVSKLTDNEESQMGIVIVARDIRKRKEAQQQIEKLAFRDSITELPNRRYLFEEYDSIVESLDDDTGVLLYLGLSDFNEIKHSLGPQKTETLLTEITARFRTITEKNTELINWNEDEFVLLDLEAKTASEARSRAKQWLQTLEDPFEIDRNVFRLQASIGIALRSKHGTDLEDLITKADLARDKARKLSSRGIKVYEEGIQERASKLISLKNSLRNAINREELELIYHPIISSDMSDISRLEVLLRWNHASEGHVPPTRIIEMAEDINMISQLGTWIFRKSCEDLSKIRSAIDSDSLKLSVNLAASQLQFQEELLESIETQINRNGLEPGDFIFEITETTAMQDIEFSREVLASIQEKGASVAVDDFGTGHSSIQYLMDLPIDTLKIDKSFILNLFKDTQNQILVETMLFMAHQLDLNVVAEGVETERQRDFLLTNNCDYLQGFLWTEPLGVKKCIQLLQQWPEEPTAVN
ncbi:MAG: EAL domain-containing protein [bacterium]